MTPTVKKARSRGIPKKRLKFNESPHFLGLKLAKEELISVKKYKLSTRTWKCAILALLHSEVDLLLTARTWLP
jgi:hypothetical protein